MLKIRGITFINNHKFKQNHIKIIISNKPCVYLSIVKNFINLFIKIYL